MQTKHLLFAAALTVAFAANAQNRAPGLWESTVSLKSADGELEQKMAEMQKRLAALPPDQRAKVEAMMKGQGISMGAGGTTVQVCVTPEEARREWQPPAREHCTQEITHRSTSSLKVKFQCTQPPSSGEGEINLIGDKAYTGKLLATYDRNGKSQQMNIDMAGKWLSADCGSVKPRPSAKP